MDYQDMLKKIKDADVYVEGYEFVTEPGNGRKRRQVISGKEYIEVSWVSGGMQGGDCWGGNADSPVHSETPKELSDLDRILEILAPDISYTQFKQIDRKIDCDTRGSSYYEYYGNYTEYTYKRLVLKDLYNALKEMKLI